MEGTTVAGTSLPTNEEMMIYMKVTKTIALAVNSSDTIRDVKDKFAVMDGVPSNVQELFFAGNHLRDQKKLADYNVCDGSTVDNFLGSLHIKAPSIGKVISIDANSWETVKGIKDKIHDREGIPAIEIALIYIGRELEDSRTMASYNIEMGSTIFAVFSGENSKMKIYVNTDAGETIELDVKPWFRVENIKAMIESIASIPVYRQKIRYAGVPMEDKKTLLHYDVQRLSTLRMVLIVRVFVELKSGKRIKMELEGSHTIGTIKKKIQATEFIPSVKQVMTFTGSLLEDDRTVDDYKIQDGSTLQLCIHLSNELQFFVRMPGGNTITIKTLDTDSIASLKNKIHGKEGIPVNRQKLIFTGKLLDDDHSLADYNIRNESTIHLGLSVSHYFENLKITVNTPKKKALSFDVLNSETVDSLKDKIEATEGIPQDQQKLIFSGKRLKEGRPLSHYGITEGSIITVKAQPLYA